MTHLMKEFCIEIKNTPGELARICTALGAAGINLHSIAVDCIGKQGFVRLITNNEKEAAKVLDEKELMYSENTVIVKAFNDKPNQLAQVVEKLGAAGININALYLMQSKNGKPQVAMAANDYQKAIRTLRS